MLALIALHFLAAVSAPALIRWLDRRAFFVLALVPLAAFVWTVAQTGTVTGNSAAPLSQRISWIAALNFNLDFELTALTWLMSLLVTGVGSLVLFYCAYYFAEHDPRIWRFSAVLVAFAGSMLGLVLSNDLLLLYVFWELTTVFSYLLIGHNPQRKANRRAAMNALLVTTFGGLAMLVGFVVIGEAAGSYRISDITASPPGGLAITVAVSLILVGAVSKSALIPFHFWLPGAMAAPTPVSAYLHAAAMVKAGVYLIALLAPVFATTPGWRPTLLVLGILTMIVGGLRALRQYDIKMLLAYGTVSQLGFLITMVGAGTRAAALAGLALISAHALFKSAMFLVVGIVDRSAGTRDLRELTGLRQQMPAIAVVTVLAACSMAGIPPLYGFVAKETAFAAFTDLGADLGWSAGGWVPLAGIVIGSILTVAYTSRFVWGVFGNKPGVAEPTVTKPAAGFVLPAAILAAASLAFGFLGSGLTDHFAAYVELFPTGAHRHSLALWHGFGLPLMLSVLCVVAGIMLFVFRRYIAAAQHAVVDRIALPDAERAYHRMMRGVDRFAVEVTGRTQSGSLPLYLGIILIVVIAVPGTALVLNPDWGPIRAYDSIGQVVVGVLIIGTAVATARSRRRLRAVLLVGVTGYGTAVLFMLHGAPDLALTQVLVETVMLVTFVLVLRQLPTHFSDRPFSSTRWIRIAIGVGVGCAVGGFALASSMSRTARPVSEGFAEPAVTYGGGNNIVNVTLVDIRAWDTMGEVSVLVVAATGIASLIFLITGRASRLRPSHAIHLHSRSDHQTNGQSRTWLRAGPTLAPERRSVVFEVVTRLIFHTIIVFSLYLTLSGHNLPGGGFAGGLVAGLALMVRYLAGGRHELDEAAPVDAGVVLGSGLALATLAGLIPTLLGGNVLQSAIVDLHLPLLGTTHLVTSVFFDLGVYLVVIGVILDILRSLGGGIDQDIESEAEASV